MSDSLYKRVEALENALRRINVRGVVSEIAPSKGPSGCVKVAFGDNQISGWLPVKPMRSGDCSIWWFPDVGEGVTATNIDNGEVMPGSYTDAMPPATRNPDEMLFTFKDGGEIRHNRSSGELTIITTAKVNITTQEANITAPSINSFGDWSHNGPMVISETLEVQAELAVLSTSQMIGTVAMPAGFAAGGSGGASSSMNGTLNISGGDVLVNGISSYSHTHTDAKGRKTSTPS